MSKFLSLNTRDYIKSVVVSALTAVVAGVLPIVQSGKLPDAGDVRTLCFSAISAGLAYLLKNLMTNSKDEIGKAE
jgi:hypothetical protein